MILLQDSYKLHWDRNRTKVQAERNRGRRSDASVSTNGLQDTVGYDYRTFSKVSYFVLSTELPVCIEHDNLRTQRQM